MIHSMTGYGDSEGELGGITYAVEIKTVNNRYFKAKLKLPDSVSFLDEDIDKLLRENLSRGMADCVLYLKKVSADKLFAIDEPALLAYMERLKRLALSAGIDSPVDIGSLLALPGIVQPVSPEKEKAEQVKKFVLGITRQAIDKLKKMRAAEGAALAADMENNCGSIKKDLEQIRGRSDLVVQEYRRKLRKRIDSLLADAKLKLDEDTLAREAAIFADRSDISEEIARLDSHLQQFAESCTSDEQSGRRLDFISQEMLREANTIASKASDVEIVRLVVSIKCSIDRIKEQVQNVE